MVTALEYPKELTGSNFSTYRIGGPIEAAYQPATATEAVDVLKKATASGKKLTVLGWGGNTLIASAGISGVTLITRKMDWVKPLNSTDIEFGAGVHLAKSAVAALNQGLTGGEYMIGIPGTIGGAIRMNAGALKQETANIIKTVTLFNLASGETEIWTPNQLQFSYRHSNIDPSKHIVLSAVLSFQPGDPQAIKTMMDQSVAFRKTHHPTEPNGGSVFQNPAPDKPMGRLIDELGGKNWTEGGVRISPLHGNFIVNVNNGTSTDVLKLMLRMKTAIADHYGLEAHPENKFLGDATDEEQLLWTALTGKN